MCVELSALQAMMTTHLKSSTYNCVTKCAEKFDELTHKVRRLENITHIAEAKYQVGLVHLESCQMETEWLQASMQRLGRNYASLVDQFLDQMSQKEERERSRRAAGDGKKLRDQLIEDYSLGLETMLLRDLINRSGVYSHTYSILFGIMGSPKFDLPIEGLFEIQSLSDYGKPF